mmetsp:Transcript_86807/g.144402  ORF Transcript_86807/g.144402 Transcript_86807/m.144402 type:complete len:291 (-) Transcript_86807:542-1414(-)
MRQVLLKPGDVGTKLPSRRIGHVSWHPHTVFQVLEAGRSWRGCSSECGGGHGLGPLEKGVGNVPEGQVNGWHGRLGRHRGGVCEGSGYGFGARAARAAGREPGDGLVVVHQALGRLPPGRTGVRAVRGEGEGLQAGRVGVGERQGPALGVLAVHLGLAPLGVRGGVAAPQLRGQVVAVGVEVALRGGVRRAAVHGVVPRVDVRPAGVAADGQALEVGDGGRDPLQERREHDVHDSEAIPRGPRDPRQEVWAPAFAQLPVHFVHCLLELRARVPRAAQPLQPRPKQVPLQP